MKKYFIYTFLLLQLSLTASAFAEVPKTCVDSPIKMVKFYPNPAITFVNFEFQQSLDKGYTIQIYNFIGKKMIESNVNNGSISFNLENFYRGLYIFQLRDKSGNILESGKFQVTK